MKKKLIVPVILVLIVLPTLLPFFNSKFFYTQDYIFIARLHQMYSAISSGQFPVRWAPDLRFGEPLFNFYAPLPYYLGVLIHSLGFNFIWVAKILFMLSSLISAVSMYLLASKLFGKNGGVLAATLYTYAPYRAVDMYVRGALSETWSFVFLPLIFYTSLLLVKELNLKNLSFLSLSLAGLFLTHNVTTLMFIPFLLIWWVYMILKEKKIWAAVYLFLASVLGLGLASFFLLPAFFERDLIQTKYLIVGYFDFRAHFVAFKQFFSLFWGYGSSLWGLDDGLSFQIGLSNLVILALAAILGVVYRKDRKLLGMLIFLGVSFLFSLLLQHNKSAFIWEAIPTMAFIQFPWRFLAISVFIVPIVGALISGYFKGKFKVIYFLLIGFTILINVGYFKPKEYVDNNFFDKFLNTESMHRGADLTKDYLPIWVIDTDGERFEEPRAKRGEIKISDFKKNSTSLNFSVNSFSDSLIELPVTYFPGWEVRGNSKLIPQTNPSKMGLIIFEIPKGDYKITVGFKDVFIRTLGNLVSLGSFLLIIIIFIYKKFNLR